MSRHDRRHILAGMGRRMKVEWKMQDVLVKWLIRNDITKIGWPLAGVFIWKFHDFHMIFTGWLTRWSWDSFCSYYHWYEIIVGGTHWESIDQRVTSRLFIEMSQGSRAVNIHGVKSSKEILVIPLQTQNFSSSFQCQRKRMRTFIDSFINHLLSIHKASPE